MSIIPSEFPRRNRLQLNTLAELAIRRAVEDVEAMGAHPLLTDAVNLLHEAREKVADYVDGAADEAIPVEIPNRDGDPDAVPA